MAITSNDTLHQALRASAIHHLQALLRLNTMTPPGNEKIAADYIAGVFRDAGIDDVQVLESAPNRANVVARLKSTNPTGRPILLMGHTDVVTVEPEKWAHDPFCGDLIDDEIWGRGALDMKSQVASELAVMLALKEQGIALNRDVIFVAFADEETGGAFGADWMWKNHRDLIDAEYAINEGGGNPMTINDTLFFTCQAGEKGSTHLRMTVTGTPGHASVPLDVTAMSKLGEAMSRLHAWQGETIFTEPVRQMLTTIADTLGGDIAAHINDIFSADSVSWEELSKLPLNHEELLSLRASTRNTVVPTMIRGGQRINVIPGEIEVDIDGRILPGQDPETFRADVQEAVGDLAEITITSPATGTAADPASPFFDAINASIGEMMPGSELLPVLCTGGTDAPLIPGVKVYGFYPMLPSARLPIYDTLVHGHNERIHIDDLTFATRFIHDVVVRFAGE